MRLKQLLVVAFLSANSLAVMAQKYEWKTATSGGYPYKYVTNDPMGARFYTLKNGLTVILSQNKKEPRITTHIAVRTGSNTDPKNHTGLAHYLEHMLFKGTDKFGSLDWAKEKPLLDKIDALYEQYNSTKDEAKRKEIYKEIDKVSGEAAKFAIANEYDKMMKSIGSQRTNAHTWVEETVYDEDIPANATEKFLMVQGERFRNPILRIFHTELEAVYEEKNRSLDNDAWKIQEASHELLFPTHNYGQQTTIGTIEHLKNPSLKAIREYYNKYYVPNNMAVVMAGDLEFDETIKLVDKYMGYMKSKPVEGYKGPIEKPIAGPIVKDIYGPSAETMRIYFRSGAEGTREEMLLDIIGSILSNGKAGLLDLNLNKQQKVLGAAAGSQQYKDYGFFQMLASPKQGQSLEEVKDLLMQQLDILKKGSFDESLLKAIVANYKLSELQALENNASRGSSLTDAFIKNRGNKWNAEVAELDEMGKVTKKEIVDFANKFFGNNYIVIYKRKGEDKEIVKVDKPPITPVETNAGKQSDYVKSFVEKPLPNVQPLFLDYAKDIQRAKLGNADVLYVPNKENSLFRLTYRFDQGNWNNKLLGMAAQYIQFVGTDKMSAEEISKEFYNLACSFNVFVQNEETVVSISGLQENFDKAVNLFEHLVRNAKPDAAALEGLKNRTEKARANNKLNKQAIANALRSYATYGAVNPTNYVLSEQELKNLKAEDLTNLLRNMMNYQHKITYYGPTALPALTAQLQTVHKLPASWSENPNAVAFNRQQQTENKVLFADYDQVQAEIYWVKNLDAYDPKQEALVNLFNGYFGGGMGSIVFQTIRESKALAYSTYAFVQNPGKKNDNFAVVAYVGSQADKLHEAIAGMNELLTDLPKAEQGFENAKKSLMKDIETDRITKDGIINSYLSAEKKGVTHDMRKDNYVQYANLKMDDINKYHQSSLSKKPYTYAIVASDKRVNLDELKKYGEVKKVSLEELFGY
ncbi:M16 family metallopeptidase [Aridibaculum aurantiacum]|uniref:M16 family metallopeptidase n=1 Tax=Aridibaculum aurantiacum TaxID=2810307 RepID=UPI001A95695B|nr:M16 family metallopeptidase [Aridibaculum aurantiacum]